MNSNTLSTAAAAAAGAAAWPLNSAWRASVVRRWQALAQALRRRPALPGWFVQAHGPDREAAAVRALADSYRHTDPSFARDLYAAADRYETQAQEHKR